MINNLEVTSKRARKNEKIYKEISFSNSKIFPGDLLGSPDEFFSLRSNYKSTLIFIDDCFFKLVKKYFGENNETCLSRLGGHSTPKTFFVPQVLIQNELSRLGLCTIDKYNKRYLNFVEELNYNLSSLSNFDVENILILDCFLNASSFDQIGQFNFNASAKYGLSFACGDNSFALDSNSLYDCEDIIVINSFNLSIINSISLGFNLEYLTRSGMFCFNSSKTYFGENNSNLRCSEFIIVNRTGFSLKNENKILASSTNFIYHPSCLCLFQTLSFSSLPNFKQSSSVSSDFSNILSKSLSNRALLAFSDKNTRTDSEILSSGKELSCFFNSSGMDRVMFGIFDSPQSSVYSVKDVQLFKLFDFEWIKVSELKKDGAVNDRDEIKLLYDKGK